MRRFLAALLAAILLLCTPVFAAENSSDSYEGDASTNTDTTAKLVEILNLLTSYSLNYNGESAEELVTSALLEYLKQNPEALDEFLDILLQQQDKYSHFMEPEIYDDAYFTDTEFVGIGVSLDDAEPYSGRITGVFVGSPAEQAGLLAGDIIITIDGENVEGKHYSELSTLIRGEKGTEVTLGVLRDGEAMEFKVVRQVITVSDIEFRDLGDGIAYIRISQFRDIRTYVDFVKALDNIYREGYTAIVYDLRNNLGGDVTVLYNMLQYAVTTKGAELFTLAPRNEVPNVYYSNALGQKVNSVAVLINGNTASAAEMFAGALKYSEGAVLVGETSYGKGVGQYHFELSDGSVAIITNFEILLPGSISYNSVGIDPDIAVENTPVLFPEYDTLSPLGSEAISAQSSGIQVRGLEERLGLLGMFDGTADNVFDDATLAAVNAFQEEYGFAVTPEASPDMLEALDLIFRELAESEVALDLQLNAAIDALLAAAHMPLGCTGAVDVQ